MHASELVALVLFCTAMSLSPGPNTTLSTTLAANFGWRAALPFCTAVPVGWLVLLLTGAVGMGRLVTEWPLMQLFLKALGLGYMVWMAYRLSGIHVLHAPNQATLSVGFARGVLLQLLNVKAWMLSMSVVQAWLLPSDLEASIDPQRLMVVCAVLMVFAFGSNLIYALMGALLRRWLAQGMRLKWFNRFMALLLLGTAAWMSLI